MLEPIGTVEEFYAHALAIEREAAKCYRGVPGALRRPRRGGAGGALRQPRPLRAGSLPAPARARPGTLKLPELPPDRYRWLESGPPETVDHKLVYRVATPRELLEIALKAERNAKRFFEWVAGTTANGDIHALAEEMAREEAEHVQWVTRAIEYVRADGIDWDELLAAGGGPGLALGGRAALRKGPPPAKVAGV